MVGLVESHGRRATALTIDGLEVVPRRRIEHRGLTVEEMDTGAIVHRRRAVCLVGAVLAEQHDEWLVGHR